MSKLYRVRKIFDLRTNEAIDETVMCGQAAIAYVPSDEYRKMLEIRDTHKKKFAKWADNAKFEELWLRQPELEPIIGLPIYFVSVKLDAGWYRTSMVEKVERDGRNGDLIVTTCGKRLLIREDD